MNDKTQKIYEEIIKTIDRTTRPLSKADYQVLLDELCGEIESRIEAIEQETGMV